MKLKFSMAVSLLLTAVILAGCSSAPIAPIETSSAAPAAEPQNSDILDIEPELKEVSCAVNGQKMTVALPEGWRSTLLENHNNWNQVLRVCEEKKPDNYFELGFMKTPLGVCGTGLETIEEKLSISGVNVSFGYYWGKAVWQHMLCTDRDEWNICALNYSEDEEFSKQAQELINSVRFSECSQEEILCGIAFSSVRCDTLYGINYNMPCQSTADNSHGDALPLWETPVIFTSHDQLERNFYQPYRDVFDFNSDTNSEWEMNFGNFADQYVTFDEDFFSRYDLIILFRNEPSGSIRHELMDVLPNEQEPKSVRIRRNIPYACTEDMATWILLLTVPKGSCGDDMPVFEFVDNNY